MARKRFPKAVAVTALSLLAAALGAWAALHMTGYFSDIAEAKKRVADAEVRRTPCGSVEFKEIGQGPPVVVSHGAGGGFDQGLDLFGALSDFGFRMIAVSRFGYLGSPLPEDASPQRQADAYACLLDSLGLERASVLGASAGAPSALQFALRYPERTDRLILVAPAMYAPRPDDAPPVEAPAGVPVLAATLLRSDVLYWLTARLAPRLLIGTILATPPDIFDRASREEQERVLAMVDHILPLSARRFGLINDAVVLSRIPPYELDRIAAPTLLTSAQDDRYGTADAVRYAAKRIPNATAHILEQGGHIGIGHNEELLREIGVFLKPH